MFRATSCSSSGESIVSIQPLVYVTRNGHQHKMTYIRGCIDTIDSPDDEHEVAQNMYRTEINTWKRIVHQFGHLP